MHIVILGSILHFSKCHFKLSTFFRPRPSTTSNSRPLSNTEAPQNVSNSPDMTPTSTFSTVSASSADTASEYIWLMSAYKYFCGQRNRNSWGTECIMFLPNSDKVIFPSIKSLFPSSFFIFLMNAIFYDRKCVATEKGV